MNVRLDDVNITSRDGKPYHLDQVKYLIYISGLFERRTN